MTAAVLAALHDVDRALATAGAHALTPYWKREAERFYAHPSAQLLVENVGRGGVKSITSTRMAIAEVLAGDFAIPPGERHYFTHVSENMAEATKTLRILEAYLRILRVPFTRSGETIELDEVPRGFKVLACRVGAVSGWRCIGWTADECAKWSNDGADPSAEVIASIRAMTVTHANARGRMISSPLGTLGYFYEALQDGDTAEQLTGHAPTWIANPSITEAQTHRLERNESIWRREYAAVPVAGSGESLFSPELLNRCMRGAAKDGSTDLPVEAGVSYAAAMDAALSGNSWTFVIAGRRRVAGRIKRSIVVTREWKGTREQPLDPFRILGEIARLCERYDVGEVWGDQHHGTSLQAIAARPEIDLAIRVEPATAQRNLARYEQMFTWLADSEVELPTSDVVRADLLGVRRVVTLAGIAVRLDTQGARHSDYAPAIAMALDKCLADPEDVGPEPNSPAYFKAMEDAAEQSAIRALAERQNPTAWYLRDDLGVGVDVNVGRFRGDH